MKRLIIALALASLLALTGVATALADPGGRPGTGGPPCATHGVMDHADDAAKAALGCRTAE